MFLVVAGGDVSRVYEEVQALLDRFTFGSIIAPFRPRLSVDIDEGDVEPRPGGRVQCVFSMTAPDRDTKKPIKVSTRFFLKHGIDLEAAQRLVWENVVWRFMHELGEGFRFDGDLLYNPHDKPHEWPWRRD